MIGDGMPPGERGRKDADVEESSRAQLAAGLDEMA
jgi:hypothetical protein